MARSFVFGALLCLPIVISCAARTGSAAPHWTLTDIRGERHELADYSGKLVVLDFWATWCAPCKQLSAELQTLHEEFSHADVAIVAIHIDDRGDPKQFAAQHDHTYTSLTDGAAVAEAYGVRAVPTLVVLDAEGQIIHRQTGYRPGTVPKLIEVIRRHLAAR